MTRSSAIVHGNPYSRRSAWQKREAAKFEDGTYKCPPWQGCTVCNKDLKLPEFEPLPPIAGHFAHISTKDKNLVAYTQNEEKGEKDIQTPMKPGRYIKQFYSNLNLPDPLIAKLAGLIFQNGEEQNRVLFAETPDEVEFVFRNGPPTCMTRDTNEFASAPIHPTRAYAGPDLKVAYVKNPQNGKISARALVWEAKKIYSQLVGDYGTYTSVLRTALESMGYVLGSLQGARISVIEPVSAIPFTGIKKAFVAPCVDTCNHYKLDEEGKFLIIDPNGNFHEQGWRSGIFACK